MKLIENLLREKEQLEKDIRENPDPRVQKLTKVEELIAVYAPSSARKPLRILPRPGTSNENQGRPKSKASRIRSEVTELLANQGATHRKAILNHLVAKELMGHEKNPMASLAAYLSEWRKDFVSDGDGNFSLPRRDPRDT